MRSLDLMILFAPQFLPLIYYVMAFLVTDCDYQWMHANYVIMASVRYLYGFTPVGCDLSILKWPKLRVASVTIIQRRINWLVREFIHNHLTISFPPYKEQADFSVSCFHSTGHFDFIFSGRRPLKSLECFCFILFHFDFILFSIFQIFSKLTKLSVH